MNTLRRLYPFLRPYRGRLLVIILFSAVLSLLSTASIGIIWPITKVIFADTPAAETSPPATDGAPSDLPVESLAFADQAKGWLLDQLNATIINPTDKVVSLRNLCILILVIFLLKNVVKYITYVLNTVVEERMMKDVRDEIFRRTVGLSMNFFNTKRSGELISVITNDVNAMNSALTPTLGVVIREPLQVVLFLALLLMFNPTLTLIAFSTSILSIILIRILTTYVKRYSGRMQSKLGDITARLQETFQNVRIIKGYAAEEYETDRFRKETKSYVRSSVKHSAVVNMMNPSSEIFAIAALSIVLFYGGYQVVQGEMPADELLTFLFLLFAIMQPIVAVFSIPTTIQRGLVAAERVVALLKTRPTVVNGKLQPSPLHRELQFLNVRFSYRPGQPVLRDVTLTVKKGQTVALVGPSGGGKSTLMDLVARFYDPTDGGIYLDGTDIREFDISSYRSMFGIVTQEPLLFNDTVWNNIAYNMPEATEEMVIEAAKAANAHEFISRMPEGYQTVIGDRGLLLSGGQRQRLAIARALVRDPEILLFDEATSALDSESERLVQEAIDRLLVDRTAIVIAHRLSTVKNAHAIAVIQEGAVVECGTHEELIRNASLYRKLYDVQFREER